MPSLKDGATMSDRSGQELGSYHLLRLLGSGGFAEVYLGQHIHLHMQAAIKVLHAHLAAREIEHFQQEAQTIVDLAHPHIVRLLNFAIEGNVAYLVMEYAPGGSLRT